MLDFKFSRSLFWEGWFRFSIVQFESCQRFKSHRGSIFRTMNEWMKEDSKLIYVYIQIPYQSLQAITYVSWLLAWLVIPLNIFVVSAHLSMCPAKYKYITYLYMRTWLLLPRFLTALDHLDVIFLFLSTDRYLDRSMG